ncbi:2203_t:CDS:2, partial [Acaulospora colombiana]
GNQATSSAYYQAGRTTTSGVDPSLAHLGRLEQGIAQFFKANPSPPDGYHVKQIIKAVKELVAEQCRITGDAEGQYGYRCIDYGGRPLLYLGRAALRIVHLKHRVEIHKSLTKDHTYDCTCSHRSTSSMWCVHTEPGSAKRPIRMDDRAIADYKWGVERLRQLLDQNDFEDVITTKLNSEGDFGLKFKWKRHLNGRGHHILNTRVPGREVNKEGWDIDW